jgi:SAM-dependent methyltransferase
MNHFGHASAAARYASGRPYVHPLIVTRVAATLPGGRVGSALDVGCGTGQSTVALAAIADRVVGVDVSAAMLAHAPPNPRIQYIEAPAEDLPLPSASFDLVTAGLAFHWFDRNRFLAETRRVLKPGGWLVTYGAAFGGRMDGNDDYERWNREQYVRRYPTPPRNVAPFADDDARLAGFLRERREEFTHLVELNPEQLVAYLTTQSNIIAAAEGGAEDIASIADWLLMSVRPLFRTAVAAFPFDCGFGLFRKQDSRAAPSC